MRVHDITVRWLKQCLMFSKLFILILITLQAMQDPKAEEENYRGGGGTQRLHPTKVQSYQRKETFGR